MRLMMGTLRGSVFLQVVMAGPCTSITPLALLRFTHISNHLSPEVEAYVLKNQLEQQSFTSRSKRTIRAI